MRRWIPFIFLFGIAILSTVYLLLFTRTKNYIPSTQDPSLIYQEACAECHGKKGSGRGLIYPSLIDLSSDENNIRQVIRHGTFFMPAFPFISDSTLIKLSHYVSTQSFLDSAETNSEN